MPTISLEFLDGERATFPAKSGETLLAAARRAGIRLSSDCEIGDCQTCRATCLSGEIEYDEFASISLSQSEVEAGEILPCVVTAATDIEFRVPYERSKLVAAKPFSIKVEAVKRLSASVVSVSARMLGLAPLKFLPGQYVHLQVPGTSQWRSYSMANAPSEAKTLEFLVRLLDDGIMSRYLIERAAPGDVIQCRGPQGTFYLRSSARPLLMVAGGTGLAPMVSMLRQMVTSGDERKVKLCFGVNEERDLFFADELNAIVASLPHLEVRIAIARGVPPVGIGSGVATDLIGSSTLADTEVYLCGPPAMTECARMLINERGANAAAVFSERFVPSA
ncbi:FAD-binding oxidoreductase [Bradyrhizobium guangdongense]|uniref:FAD-binding oxidoreductase n=1 Tax=Bradyrhizobium guangdongense TaxID=1325090 RepID=UPI00131A310C|nr:2Fe-2S iron-sulfur cluster binding domain-containing protein [Bradyrhizobium guangdongense]